MACNAPRFRDCPSSADQKLLENAPADMTEESTMPCANAPSGRPGIGICQCRNVEFLVDARTNEFWFMVMNTRLQVGTR
jgi:acetyl/propionyl-CoA carboxylase alpha subunit